MQYYGTRLSENISRREPEGYLLCLNVPVARTGIQEYLPEELGLPPGPAPVPVSRSETEVFSPETVASFEGMPVTNDHPADGVDIDNIRRLQMGHAHNVRRGTGEESDLLLADLIITDPRLIEAILGGKREISCGYTYELAEEDGQYYQRKIRGNHIAVVDAGRAGRRVSIRDHKGETGNPGALKMPPRPVSVKDHICERSTSIMKKSITKLLARMAKDGDIETVAEFIGEMLGEETETPAVAVAEAAAEAVGAVEEAVEAAAEEPAAAETPAVTDEDGIAGIIERLDKLIALLTPAGEPAADEDPAEDPEANAGAVAQEISGIVEEVVEAAAAEETEPAEAAAEVAAIVESILEPAVSTTLEEETEGDCGDPDKNVGSDALRAALLAFRPLLVKMPRSQRRKACADIAAHLRRSPVKGVDSIYADLGTKRRDPGISADLGKRIMASRNPNYKQ